MPRFGFSTAESLERGRDVDTVRGFLGGQGPTALFDLPWMPLYLAFVYFLHPLLGALVLGGAVVLTLLTIATEIMTRRLAGSTHQAAIEGFRRPVERYVEVFSEALTSWDGRAASPNYPGYDKMVGAIRAQTPESLREGRVAYVGTPAEVVEQVRDTRELFGDVEPSMQINFGGMPTAEARRTLELFASEVMPAFLV